MSEDIDKVLDEVFGPEKKSSAPKDAEFKGRASGYTPPSGFTYDGTIDLSKRPIYKFPATKESPGGGYGTFFSTSFQEDKDGPEILIPQIWADEDGKPGVHNGMEAIKRYKKTGEHLGKYKDVEEADKAADFLHHFSYDQDTGDFEGIWRDDIEDITPLDLSDLDAFKRNPKKKQETQ